MAEQTDVRCAVGLIAEPAIAAGLSRMRLPATHEAEVLVAEAQKMFSRGVKTAGWWNVGFYRIATGELEKVSLGN